ncbi:GlxA family transcriptional regulator [Undibacterium sp.]|uniref:GlxA family transcriptional regulator n=1 Tax=Undibacterium sp. TaxID=1914977 RepID=UPI002C106828|nr:helix-turn-helix domain-containing protein [Undibacterium sp.]HTD04425.1 helix-turn-helix domain-containing protein [Undibacterium sp.]
MASAVTGPLDIFAVANAIWAAKNREQTEALFRWSIRSLDGNGIRTPSGIYLAADGVIDAGGSATDVVLLPGIYVDKGVPGLLANLARLQPLYPLLQHRFRQGSLLAANCNASFLLAEACLLDGGHATTTWWLERAFRARYPQVELRLADVLTEYRHILCSGAGTSYLNLSLHLVQRYAGQDIAAACAKSMLIDANRSSQMPYVSMTQQDSQPHSDALVLRAQQWMGKRQDRPFSLRDLATHLAVSERTVIRHFHQALGSTPTAYAQLLKIDLAKRLLESSTLTLETVAERIGYADLGSLRRLFKRETGLSPADYRQQFRQRKSMPAREQDEARVA